MKKYFTLTLMIFIITFKVEAQTFEWLQTVEVAYEFNPGMIQYNTCANPQGGCYFYGIQEHISFYNESMGVLFLKKYSAEGTETWSREIFGESAVKGMVSDDNGDIYISGEMLTDAIFWSEDTLVKTGIGTNSFVARISSSGDLNWCINLNELPMEEGFVTEMTFHNDLLYVAYSNWMNAYVLIYNEDGEYLDSVVQEDVNMISGLALDQEGNLFTAGSCAGWQAKFGGVPYPAPFDYTTYLAKYNSSHEPVWVKYIEDITCTFPQVRVDDEGWIYFAGQLMNETLFDTIAINGPQWAYDFFLARLNPGGQYQWVIECPEVMTGDASVGSLQFLDTDPDGNALLTGFTRGIMDWGNGVISDVTANYQDIIVWSYSPDGQVNWINTAGGEGYEVAHTISAGPDGNAYLAGVISGLVQFDTITVEATGLVDPFVSRLEFDIISGTPHYEKHDGLQVYPNPASDRFFINSGSNWNEYRLFNSTGQMVQSGRITGQDREISVSGLKAGIYLLSLEDKDGPAGFTRIIVQ